MEKEKGRKCNSCLRKATARTTGVAGKTLRVDMGGAVFYVILTSNGGIEVSLNCQNLFDGNFLYCIWTGEDWII